MRQSSSNQWDGKYYCLDCQEDITGILDTNPDLCDACYKKRYGDYVPDNRKYNHAQ